MPVESLCDSMSDFEGYLYLIYFFFVRHVQELWLCNYGFSWVDFPVHICVTLYSLQLHCCWACKFLLLGFPSVLSFSCNFCSSPPLDLSSYFVVFHAYVCFAKSPISFISHHRFPYSWKIYFLLTCLLLSTDFNLKLLFPCPWQVCLNFLISIFNDFTLDLCCISLVCLFSVCNCIQGRKYVCI